MRTPNRGWGRAKGVRLAALAALVASGTVGCADDRPRNETSTAGSIAPPTTAEPTVEPDRHGAALLAALDRAYSPERTLGYDRARDALFLYEERTDGVLRDVYSGLGVSLPPGEDPTAAAARLGVNTEHTWPQSYGAEDEPLKSDLHHLFPVQERVNTSRGNLPLGEVPDDAAAAWYRLGQSQSNRPAEDGGSWAERGDGRFEPPDAHKGDAARALFYVAAVYPEVVRASDGRLFLETMLPDLLRWHAADPVDGPEADRNTWIAERQGTPNPFVLDPTLAERAFGDGLPGTEPPAPAAQGGPDLWVSELHYDNEGADVDEGVELAGADRQRADGWTLALYNGSDGTVYRTVSVNGTLSGGALWIEIDGLQNGAPDGLALVRPDGSVAEFLSYEGGLRAADGPAAGMTARDAGMAEGAGTPPGRSLSRTAPASGWRAGPATPGVR